MSRELPQTAAAARRGFTLVETLAAGVILGLSAAVLGITVSSNMRSLALARDFQRAAELLDRTLTKIDTIGPAQLLAEGPTAGGFNPPHERFIWTATIERRFEGDLYDVTVRIAWPTPDGKQRSVEAQTFLNDPADLMQSELDWNDL